MNKEENKAINKLKEIIDLVKEDLQYDKCDTSAILDQTDLNALALILDLVNKQDKTIKKQDKVIDKMAEDLTTPIHGKEWVINHYLKGE